ncbi:MAG: pimeloyl-ACP methyl ester carboxylesterase [Myxococcota bacterium]|jgi:pimeloyl-ACP methyl ester carboxylesterase
MRDWVERMPGGTAVDRITLPSGGHLRVYSHGAGPVVLFLHGFPERAISWQGQFGALPGYRCVAPDLRGFGGSHRPRGRWHYTPRRLTAELAELIAVLGGQVDVVAHDWGAALAWELAMDHPALVRRLCVLNGPPLPLMVRALSRPSQLARSWYFLVFQLPVLPEWRLAADPERMMARTFRGAAGLPEVFDRAALAPFVEQARAGFGGVDYYRGALASFARPPRPVRCPVRVLFGVEDPALDVSVFADPANYAGWVEQLEMVRIPDAGHWLQQEAPDRVNAELREFLGC